MFQFGLHALRIHFGHRLIVCCLLIGLIGITSDFVEANEPILLTGHKETARIVLFSPTGNSLATCHDDASVLLWDVATGKKRHSIQGKRQFEAIGFSADNKNLFTAHPEPIYVEDPQTGKVLEIAGIANVVHVWNTATSESVTPPLHLSGGGYSLAFSPDAKVLATRRTGRIEVLNADTSVRLWDLKSGKQIGALTGHKTYVERIAFSPDSRVLATGSYRQIKLWDISTGKELANWSGLSASPTSLGFSPDSKLLAACTWGDNSPPANPNTKSPLKIFDLASGKEWPPFQTVNFPFFAVAFSPDGKTLGTGWQGGAHVRLWDVATQKVRVDLKCPRDVRHLAFSPDGKKLSSSCSDGTLLLWDLEKALQPKLEK